MNGRVRVLIVRGWDQCLEESMFGVLFILLALLGMSSPMYAQSEVVETPMEFPYEPSNAVVQYDCTKVSVEEDGTTDILYHYRTALLTERAIREYAQDVSIYNLNYDTVEVVAARVHLPDGRVVDVSPENIKDVPMPAFGKFFLEKVREKIVTFPELTMGAEIEIMLRELTREVPMDGEFSFSEYFRHTDPIRTKYVEIEAPSDLEFRWKVRNGSLAHSTRESEGKAVHVWEAESISHLTPEPGMPPIPEVLPQLLVTSIDGWEVWSRWYYDLSGPMMEADDDIRTKVHELIENAPNRHEALRAIFYFVSNQIRYVDTSLSGRKAGYKPEPAAVTFRNRYGVCRDKAALMVTMLREAGFDSDIVLMNPVWKIDEDIPADQFNHAIVAVYEGGEVVLLDPTMEKTRDFLAAMEQDKAVLLCTEEGKDLEWTPIEPSENHLYQITADSRLSEDGVFHSEVKITTAGFPDLVLRNVLQSMPPERRENVFKQIIQSVAPTAELESLEISDMMDFDQPVVLKIVYSAEDYATQAGNYLLFRVPGQAQGLDFITSFMLNGADLMQREYDLRLLSPFAVRVDETVAMPEGWKVRSLPEDVDMDYEDYRLARDCTADGSTVRIRRILDFSTLNVTLDRYHEIQELQAKDETMDRGRVVLVQS